MRLGFVVLLVGVLFLLRNMHYIDPLAWDTLWPIIVILVGISMVLRSEYGHGRWCNCWSCRSGNKGGLGAYGVCNCDCDGCKDCKK